MVAVGAKVVEKVGALLVTRATAAVAGRATEGVDCFGWEMVPGDASYVGWAVVRGDHGDEPSDINLFSRCGDYRDRGNLYFEVIY